MEPDRIDAAFTELDARIGALENAIALLAYRIECEKEQARKWNGPDLFTKEGE